MNRTFVCPYEIWLHVEENTCSSRSTDLRSDDDLEELTLAQVVKEAARDRKNVN